MAGSKNNNTTSNNSANVDPNGGFKTVAFGFDKNDVTMYIASLRKKMKQMEEEFDQKLTLAVENPAASNEALKRERDNIRAEMERTWSDKINDRNIIIKQQQRDLDEVTKRAEDLKVKNEALRGQLSSAISAAAAANANRKPGAVGEEDSEEVAKANADVLAQAEEQKALAQEYKSRSEKFKKLAEEYQAEIIQFKANADQYKENALQYKDNAEQYKVNEELYKSNAEQYKASAEQYKANAEKYKAAAEQYKSNAEKYKAAADQYREWAEKYKAEVEKLQTGAKDLYEKLKDSLGPIAELAGASVSDGEKIWETVSGVTLEEIPHIAVEGVEEPEEIDVSEPAPVQIAEPKPVQIVEPEIKEPEEPEKSIDELTAKLESVASESAEEIAAAKLEEQRASAKIAEEEAAAAASIIEDNAVEAEAEPAAADDSLSSIISDDLGDLMADDDMASLVEEVSAPAPEPPKKKAKKQEKPVPAPAVFDPFADEDDDLSSLLADPSAESVIRPANSKSSAEDDFADLLATGDDSISDDLKDFLITDDSEKPEVGGELDPSLLSDIVIDPSDADNNGDLSEMLQEKAASEYSQFGDLFVEPVEDPDNQFEIRAESDNSIDELKSESLSAKKTAGKKEEDPFDFTFNDESDDDDMSTDL
ncbi:MAG: hypothetical protein NC203_09245 [Firmicutes bacterium]|nr:hypothetical protein [Bacillota bacterium]